VAVRFDSLDPRRGRSVRFEGLQRRIEARALADVAPAVAELQREVAAGRHAAGFIAYEAAPAFDAALATREPAPDLPLLWFEVYRRRIEGEPLAAIAGSAGYELGTLAASASRERYAANVREILELIAAGDSYQVNLTFRLSGEFAGSDIALYRDLCLAQRSAWCSFLRLDRYSVISASPELFFTRRGEVIELRPMKGTRPRGRWSEEDRALAQELVHSPKERAENLMIVDLLRNDVGRIAEFGSVRVPALFEVERYPTVHQLTSTVTARPREGADLLQLLRALFPSGSVTGAPKVRTSAIIRDLEDSPRGVYTGAIGFVSPDVTSFSVAIRTALLDRETGRIEVGVGSGITADSDAESEYGECLAKGAFLTHRPPELRLIESMRLEASGGFPLLEGHLQRLSLSAEYLGFMLDAGRVRMELAALAARLPAATYKVRLVLDRQGELELSAEPIPERSGAVRIGLADEPVDARDPLLYHKTTARAVYDRRRSSHPELDDVLLVNHAGELTESTTANLVLELDGALVTPPIETGLLPGVLREQLLSDGVVTTRRLRPSDLERARRIFLVNSVRGWREGVLASREGVPAAPGTGR
jgi:para-aminobenzoate synthetase / 4-amino-4-deoxychorismate lyase